MTVFVDTSALYAALDADDADHADAVELLEHLRDTDDLATHNYIHVEAEALVRRRLGAQAAAALIDRLLPAMRTMWVDGAVHEAALAAVRAGGRGTSFVDEVSFIVMRANGIERALTFDHDFVRGGFATVGRLPRRLDRRLSEEPEGYEAERATDDLVGVAEIAARSGHSTNTVQSWRRRHVTFPTPAADLASGPVWRWATVEGWIAETRRARRSVPTTPGSRSREPTLPLFASGTPDLGSRVDDLLAGFGER